MRWPLVFATGFLGQEYANSTAPVAAISSLAALDSPVGGELRFVVREQISDPRLANMILRWASAAAVGGCTAWQPAREVTQHP